MDVDGRRLRDASRSSSLYCRRVAGAIGRVCLAIFGLREDAALSARDAEALADDLGVALQLTNILRDVREDAENGRVYLPGRGPAALRPGRASEPARGAAACWRGSRRRRWRRSGAGGRPARARALRGRARARVVRARDGADARCSTGAAPRACWRWPASTAGCSSASRRDPERGARRAHLAAGAREGAGSRRAACSGRGARERRARVVRRVGGGLAGITAALDCAAAGAEVTLVEVRPRLGGAAYSFERDGL